MLDFTGKNVIVTGAEMGIGKSIAEKFIQNGANVMIVGHSKERGEETAKALGDKATFYFCELTDEKAVEAMMDKIVKTHGAPDVLINNAGIFMQADVGATTPAQFKNIMDVNVFGTFLMCHYAIGHMEKKGDGVIVNIASEAGISAFKNQIAYNTSKAAMIHLTKSIAVDYAQRGVRANVVCPGTTETPLFIQAINSTPDPVKERSRYENIRPMGRLGKVEEIASAVLCMASGELGYATGAVLSIDGGYTVQ